MESVWENQSVRTRPSRVLAAAPRPPAVELSTRRARVVHGGELVAESTGEGGFYGGWITADIRGPFKGGAADW